MGFAGLLLGLGLAWAINAHHDSHAPTARIDTGKIVGTTVSVPAGLSDVNQFLGVPFAQSPPKRFTLPRKPKRWHEPLQTIKKSPACYQQINSNFTQIAYNNPPPEESEDCLYLNVYAPASPAPKGGRAVMFWIYGGSYRIGHASNPLYDGTNFAAYEDVIVVAANYRTNVFGFPASPDIPLKENNIGLYDQRFALDWVQENIEAFGGNPDKVTIFGESAGGMSVDALITSYSTDEAPFRAGIMQSGQTSYMTSVPLDSRKSWKALVAAVGCTGASHELECVRNVPGRQIKSTCERLKLNFGPQKDDVTRLSDPAAARKAGKIAKVPLLVGANAQDGTAFALGLTTLQAGLFSTALANRTDLIEPVKAAYPVGGPGAENETVVVNQIYTDFGFQCNQGRMALETAALGIPTWRYFYNASFPNLAIPGYSQLGVYHSSEIALVFTSYPPKGITTQEYTLSNYMRTAWAKFAKNPAGGPGWNAIGTGSSFGGADDLDLATLGSDGQSGATVIRRSVVDYRCGVFDKVYDEINKETLKGF